MFCGIIKDSPEFTLRIVNTYKPRKKAKIAELIKFSPLIFPSKGLTEVLKKTLG